MENSLWVNHYNDFIVRNEDGRDISYWLDEKLMDSLEQRVASEMKGRFK